MCGEADPRRTRDPGCEGGLRGIQRSYRKFSKFGVWQMFSKFGLCLKTIQSVLNLFENSLNCFFVENVFVHLFEFVLKMSLNILLKNYLKTFLKIV